MIKSFYFLCIAIFLSGCLSMPYLNPPCPTSQVFESSGYSDGYRKRAKKLPLNSQFCKKENLNAMSNIYNDSYNQGETYRCSSENIEKEYIKFGRDGQSFEKSYLNDCSSINTKFNSLTKSSWLEGHKIFCSPENSKNYFENQGSTGSDFDTSNFKVCKNNKSNKSKSYYISGLKKFCSLDNIYSLGLNQGDSGGSLNTEYVKKCEKFDSKAVSTYISGFNRGATRLEQRRHREEQDRIAREQLEAQRQLVQEQIDAQNSSNVNSGYYGSNDISCSIEDQSGTIDVSFCSGQSNSIRCYAEVEFENGSESKIMGGVCVDSFSDCWSSGEYRVEPACAN